MKSHYIELIFNLNCHICKKYDKITKDMCCYFTWLVSTHGMYTNPYNFVKLESTNQNSQFGPIQMCAHAL